MGPHTAHSWVELWGFFTVDFRDQQTLPKEIKTITIHRSYHSVFAQCTSHWRLFKMSPLPTNKPNTVFNIKISGRWVKNRNAPRKCHRPFHSDRWWDAQLCLSHISSSQASKQVTIFIYYEIEAPVQNLPKNFRRQVSTFIEFDPPASKYFQVWLNGIKKFLNR